MNESERLLEANRLAEVWYQREQVERWIKHERIALATAEELAEFLTTHFRFAFAKGHFLGTGKEPR